MPFETQKLIRSIFITFLSIISGMVALMTPDWKKQLLAGYGDINEATVGAAIVDICPNGSIDNGGSNGPAFQARCDSLLGGVNDGTISDQELGNILGMVTTKQTAAQSTNALEMSNVQMNNIGARFSAIRQGRQGGLHISGLRLRDSEGNLLSGNKLAQLSDSFNRAAAGDEESIFNRLGFFVNGNFGWGSREQTNRERGYNVQDFGTTLGVDYRIASNYVMGIAFGYNHTKSDYDLNAGNMKTNAFSGTLYGTFFTDDGFYIEGAFSGSGLNYETSRNIDYVINQGTAQQDSVFTSATGENSGRELEFNISGGYSLNFGALSLTPRLRLDYINVHVAELDEVGGDGWGLHVDEQNFDSFKTFLGAQVDYPLSFSWGVLIPTTSVEWVHEFLDDERSFRAHFLQDFEANPTSFEVLTDDPDRDYMNFNAGMSAQFANDIAAFVNYETIFLHKYVTDHSFTTGIRVSF